MSFEDLSRREKSLTHKAVYFLVIIFDVEIELLFWYRGTADMAKLVHNSVHSLLS